MAAEAFDRLRQSLSLIFGTEAFVVLKDIWGLDGGAGARGGALVGARAGARGGRRGAKRQGGRGRPAGSV